jgi:hypothetical protein
VGRRPKVTSPERIARERRITEILQLRMQGWSLRQIGESLSPAISAQAVFACIKRTVASMATEATEQARRLEEMRCDELTTAVYEKALGGDLPAVDRTLQIMARRARLLGLDMQPPRVGADLRELPLVKIEIVNDEELRRRVALVAPQARHLA